MALSAGAQLGAFVITSALGADGMGEVYRALDTKLGREVAIKTLPSVFAGDRDGAARRARLLGSTAYMWAVVGRAWDVDPSGERFLIIRVPVE